MIAAIFKQIFTPWTDARRFVARVALVDEHRLRGSSVWVLGSEDPEVWTVLRRRGGR